ncbi:MAG TPA: tetratricopeptide repeat protein [Pirellulales bacterium]|jgi:tetratricopeptide (TPR) repeat protein|nr:tetratricopeptide repeat protein [Pirellulales bacterium]
MADETQEDKRPKLVQRKPVSAEQRRLLQLNYDKGEQSKNRNRDYATEMFAQCVAGDPGNRVYVQAFLDNLQKKYNNKGKGGNFAGFKGMGSRATLKKSIAKGEFEKGIRAGLELLKINPWDIPALMQMAEASAGLGCYEAQLMYLNLAQKSAPDQGDVEIARACAKALANVGQFDQAMGCWERVKKHHPNNEEAQHAIAALHTDKISWVGTGKEDKGGKKGAGGKDGTRETELRAKHEADPADVDAASDLSDLLAREERYEEAETVLNTSLAATGGDIKVREHLEDIRVHRYRHQLAVAEKRAADDPSEENKKLLQEMRRELNRVELEVFRSRSERHPGNTTWKYEYAMRLSRSANYTEAIKRFQEARGDPKRKAAVYIELGNCFFKIKQFQLAVKSYADSLEVMTERDTELRKKALYRAGVVAMDHLNDLDAADRFLTMLAGLDFSYEDVSTRLDKINHARHKQ